MSTRGWWIALFLGAVLPCRAASALPRSDDALVPTETRDTQESPCPALTKRHWYGWQTLATDGAGIGLIVMGGALGYRGLAAGTATSIGVGALFLGGPSVHVAHGRWGIGVLDFGLRLTLPLVGAALAGSMQCSGECGGPVVVASMIGLAPIWIDAGILAHEDVPVESARHDARQRMPRSLARLGVTELHPTTLPTRHGVVLGVKATF